jgi:hypothetical protein
VYRKETERRRERAYAKIGLANLAEMKRRIIDNAFTLCTCITVAMVVKLN